MVAVVALIALLALIALIWAAVVAVVGAAVVALLGAAVVGAAGVEVAAVAAATTAFAAAVAVGLAGVAGLTRGLAGGGLAGGEGWGGAGLGLVAVVVGVVAAGVGGLAGLAGGLITFTAAAATAATTTLAPAVAGLARDGLAACVADGGLGARRGDRGGGGGGGDGDAGEAAVVAAAAARPQGELAGGRGGGHRGDGDRGDRRGCGRDGGDDRRGDAERRGRQHRGRGVGLGGARKVASGGLQRELGGIAGVTIAPAAALAVVVRASVDGTGVARARVGRTGLAVAGLVAIAAATVAVTEAVAAAALAAIAIAVGARVAAGGVGTDVGTDVGAALAVEAEAVGTTLAAVVAVGGALVAGTLVAARAVGEAALAVVAAGTLAVVAAGTLGEGGALGAGLVVAAGAIAAELALGAGLAGVVAAGAVGEALAVVTAGTLAVVAARTRARTVAVAEARPIAVATAAAITIAARTVAVAEARAGLAGLTVLAEVPLLALDGLAGTGGRGRDRGAHVLGALGLGLDLVGVDHRLGARRGPHGALEQEGDDPLTAGVGHQAAGQQHPLGRDQLGEALADAVELVLGALGGELLGGRQVALAEDDARVLQLEIIEVADLAGVDQRDGDAGATGAAGAAGAVDVDLGRLREGVVEHVRDVADVDAAGGDVGGDQEAQLVLAHQLHDPLALGLVEVAGQLLGVEALAAQHRGDQLGLLAGVAEDDRAGRVLDHDHVEQVAGLDRGGDRVEGVLDLRGGDLVARELDRDRVFHVALGDALDVVGDRGREQGGEVIALDLVEDRPDVLEEAHRQHLVALVEDDGADLREVERAAADVIEDAAGGADHRVHAGPEGGQLRVHRRAAVDREHIDGGLDGEATQLVADLLGELAGREEDQQLNAGLAGGPGVEAGGQPRDAEGAGLAAAGVRLDHDVAAGDQRVEAQGLDGRGLAPAELGDRVAQGVGEGELVEGGRQGRQLGRGLGVGLGGDGPGVVLIAGVLAGLVAGLGRGAWLGGHDLVTRGGLACGAVGSRGIGVLGGARLDRGGRAQIMGSSVRRVAGRGVNGHGAGS